tara:strand:- start:532 stop:1740 length:1209 start_codon:yes stop_codon:yes gene_type:complete
MKVVLIIGGAVSGSTAAKKLIDAGIRSVVVEQNRMPYGKIEDGLPRWHDKQRSGEYDKIDEIISNELVDYVPLTKLGKDIPFEEVLDMGWSCIYFANGAWKDRPFPIHEIENFENFHYQNPYVFWFNHYHEENFEGKNVNVVDNALVIGGGLASIDVCKITQLELVKQKVESKIENFDIVEMEHKGIPKYLSEHNINYDDLDIIGTKLIYRRNIENMPITTIPEGLDNDMIEKRKIARRKVLRNMQDKYLFDVVDCTQPTDIIVEGDKLVGLKTISNEVVDGKLVPIKNSEKIINANIFISSIGSLPEPIKGVPMNGSTYDIIDQESGKFNDFEKLHGMGNAITGQGNIKASRVSAKTVSDLTIDLINDIDKNIFEKINVKVKEWQSKSSYNGDYFEWKEKK